MMEFLDMIYGYEHFGIILFAIISILVVLFLVILFFGKKDEKKRELERTQQLANQSIDTFANVNPEPVAVDVEAPTFAPVEDIIEPVVPISNVEVAREMPTEPVLETPIIESAPIAPILEPTIEPPIVTPLEPIAPVVETPAVSSVESVAPVVEPTIIPEVNVEPTIAEETKEDFVIPNFNFDELAASIANELNELENKPQEVTPVVEPLKEEIPVSAPVTPIEEVVKPAQPKGPVTFSSVYINKPVIEKAEETPIPNPSIELPKPAEMPILNKEVTPAPAEPIATPNFSKFEGESYEIK